MTWPRGMARTASSTRRSQAEQSPRSTGTSTSGAASPARNAVTRSRVSAARWAAGPSTSSSSGIRRPNPRLASPASKASAGDMSARATIPCAPAAIRAGPHGPSAIERTSSAGDRASATADVGRHPAHSSVHEWMVACSADMRQTARAMSHLLRQLRRQEEASAALPEGSGPKALTARERRHHGASGTGGAEGPRTPPTVPRPL